MARAQGLGKMGLGSSGGGVLLSLQSCPTLGDPTDGSPPGSPVPGILQARVLEWGAIAFSRSGCGRAPKAWVRGVDSIL